MSSMLSSHGFVLATAMAVSSTLVFLAFSRQKTQLSQNPNSHKSPTQGPLRSCLYSGDKKRERKKKKVHFAENVEEAIGGGEETVRKQRKDGGSCRNEIRRIPENRIALYNGILKNRVQRIEFSY